MIYDKTRGLDEEQELRGGGDRRWEQIGAVGVR